MQPGTEPKCSGMGPEHLNLASYQPCELRLRDNICKEPVPRAVCILSPSRVVTPTYVFYEGSDSVHIRAVMWLFATNNRNIKVNLMENDT